MLVIKIIFCFLTFLALFTVCQKYKQNCEPARTRNQLLLLCIAIELCIISCILIIVTNHDSFAVPKILFFISCCIYILDKEVGIPCISFQGGLILTIIIALIIFTSNFSNTQETTTTTYNLMNVKTSNYNVGNLHGIFGFIKGSVSTESVYKYYYHTEDGGIKQGFVPVDSTTIFIVKPDVSIYLEKIELNYYLENDSFINYKIRYLDHSDITYRLYIPEDYIPIL